MNKMRSRNTICIEIKMPNLWDFLKELKWWMTACKIGGDHWNYSPGLGRGLK